MKLSQLKKQLETIEDLDYTLPNGEKVPSHYHVTEVGQVTKNFIDCGGTTRTESLISFQLWHANDFDHRLDTQKLLKIITIAEEKLNLQDAEIEVEYQSDTIGKYGLEVKNNQLHLTAKVTDCLAPDKCNIPTEKKNVNLSDLIIQNKNCIPGGGCC